MNNSDERDYEEEEYNKRTMNDPDELEYKHHNVLFLSEYPTHYTVWDVLETDNTNESNRIGANYSVLDRTGHQLFIQCNTFYTANQRNKYVHNAMSDNWNNVSVMHLR